jgi:shikimate dehydrogenase
MAEKLKKYGLIGYPVKHSFSAAMHNAAFSHLGIDAEYELFEIKPDELESFLLERKDLDGFNVTIPHKVKAKEILDFNFENSLNVDEIGNYSDLIGAINTVGRDKGSIWWTNTDAPGFVKSLKEDLGFSKQDNKDALLFGCGGAGRAVIAGLGCEDKGLVRNIYVYEISKESIQAVEKQFENFSHIKTRLKFISKDEIEQKIKDCSLLVNTTPVGMKDDSAELIDKQLLHSELSVYDVVYNRQTKLVKEAKEKRLKACNGLGMLLYQGVLGFNYWAGKEVAPVDVMRQALVKELESK